MDGLNVMLRFRPTCVVLNVGRSPGEAGRFLGALNAQLPACPVLVVSEDPYLGAEPVWENLKIRVVLRPPVSSSDLVSRIGAVLPPGSSLTAPWPQLGESVTRAIDYLSRHFDEDLDRSVRIEAGRWEQRSNVQRLAEAVVRPIRRLF